MKRPEEEVVEIILNNPRLETVGNDHLVGKIKFEDSKRIKLIQMADFYAGAMRYFFEEYEKRIKWLPCKFCLRRRKLCRHIIKTSPLVHLYEIKCFSELIYRDEKNKIITNGLFWEPANGRDSWKSMLFVDCFL